MKKIISLILLVALILAFSITATASYNGEFISYPVEGGNIYVDSTFGMIVGADDSVTTANIPESIDSITVTGIFYGAFDRCQSLKSIVLPSNISLFVTLYNIPESAFGSVLQGGVIEPTVMDIICETRTVFGNCNSLTDIYFRGSESQWDAINVELEYWVTIYGQSALLNSLNKSIGSGGNIGLSNNVKLHFNYDSKDIATNTPNPSEYIYDVADPGEGVADLVEGLADNVTTQQEAVDAVRRLISRMTTEQKSSATGIDLATLLAETAAARAATQPVTGNEIIISAANVAPVVARATSAVSAVESALISGGITTARYLSNTVTLTTTQTGTITIRVDPDILTTEVDKVRIETPNYALTFKISDLEESLTGILTFTATSETAGAAGASVARGALSSRIYYAPVTSSGYAPIASVNRKAVTVTMPDGIRGVPVTLSFASTKDASAGQAIKSTAGTVATSKYNPATGTLDGKVNESGTYTTYDSQKNFTDISNKSQEMQTAINYLASKGVINGTTETTFSPDKTIPRSDIAALLVRAIGKLDNRAAAQFNDVKPSDWYYTTAASSQKCGLFKGDDHNMFRGPSAIVRYDSVVVAARVLMLEMNYKTPGNTSQYLSRYKDTVPGWAQSEVALATKENLIVYRVDGTFSGEKAITRGDAAILIYRLFQKIW